MRGKRTRVVRRGAPCLPGAARTLTLLAAWALALGGCQSLAYQDGEFPLRAAERTVSQRDQHNTTSYIEKSYLFYGSGGFKIAYTVDSEPGGDRLVILLDGAVQHQVSGQRKGVVWVAVPTSGNHTLRFEYVKNGSVSRGRDTAQIHYVLQRDRGDIDWSGSHERFDGIHPSLSAWAHGGSQAGWGWSARDALSGDRPAVAARPVALHMADDASAFMSTQVVFPVQGCGACERRGFGFDYHVDSQPGDELRVSVDGVPQMTISGRHRYGTEFIPWPTSGTHQLEFEYVKDGAGSEGRDLAYVDNVRAYDGFGNNLVFHEFEGLDPDSQLEYTHGSTTSSVPWQTGGTYGGFVVAQAPPARLGVPLQQLGQAPAGDGYVTFDAEPVVDGSVGLKSYFDPAADEIRTSEYINAQLLEMPQYGNGDMGHGLLGLVVSADTNTLFVGIRAPSRNAEAGDESGAVSLALDGQRARFESLRPSPYCGSGHPRAPGPEDHRIWFHYRIDNGQTDGYLVAGPHNSMGTCGSYTQTGAPVWVAAADVAVREIGDSAVVQIEVRVPLNEDGSGNEHRFLTDRLLGLQVSHQNYTTSCANSPCESSDIWAPALQVRPAPHNLATYATLDLDASSGFPKRRPLQTRMRTISPTSLSKFWAPETP